MMNDLISEVPTWDAHHKWLDVSAQNLDTKEKPADKCPDVSLCTQSQRETWNRTE